jgi:hypothetical protein
VNEAAGHGGRPGGYPLVHWNFAAIGRSTLADDVDQAQVAAVRSASDGAGVGIPSVSATFNVIHPDARLRAALTAQAVPLILQDAHQDDATRVREDLLRWYDEAGIRWVTRVRGGG